MNTNKFFAREYLSQLFGKLDAFVDASTEEVFFKGNQVCEIIGYTKQHYAEILIKFVPEEDRVTWKYKEGSALPKEVLSKIWSENDFSDKYMITEPGLYSLVLKSGLPSAEPFFRWVTHEVIPSIRKDGMYVLEQELLPNSDKEALIEQLKKDLEFATSQWERYEQLNKKHSKYLAEAEEELEKLKEAKKVDEGFSKPSGLSTSIAVAEVRVAPGLRGFRINEEGQVEYF